LAVDQAEFSHLSSSTGNQRSMKSWRRRHCRWRGWSAL
jgi:hypothetical protein